MSTFRTFRAPDTRSALAMVKAALGSEAVILSTREVTNGLFRPKEIEVTAALSAPPAQNRVLAAQAYVPTAPRQTNPPLGASDMQRAIEAASEQRAPGNSRPSRPNLGIAGSSPSGTRNEPRGDSRNDARSEAREAELSDELLRLRGAMDEMRREMRQVTGQVRIERDYRLPPAGAELLKHLVNRGVEEALAEESVRQAVEASSNMSGATLLASVREALAERVVSGRAPWLPDNRRRIIAMVGPTGVGKTTTLAKIAARSIMESKLKVALITIDTYRIGASEQILRYGEIMAVPTFVARDRIELVKSIEKSANADLILIDTAGRSVNEAVARQAEMLRSIEGVQLFLTMSACSGPREMAAAAERYRTLQPERLIVTKVDEAVGPGSLLSASVRIGRPVVAVTDGQRVPEDIHALSSSELVDLVLGQVTQVESTVKVGGQ
jgi:flagellar biosynthesis protein FlhF